MRRQTGAGAIACLILACVFGATLLLSLAAGAGVYRRVAARAERGANTRVGLAYLTTKVHSADAMDPTCATDTRLVYPGTFGGGDAIYLLQDMDGLVYETILYVYDGSLRELLCERGWELEPEDGEVVTPAQGMALSEPSEGILRVAYTEAGGVTETVDLFLRSDLPRAGLDY